MQMQNIKPQNIASNIALSRLLQLASPMLPVGAYSYSQGLEWAIECGEVIDLASAKTWISDALMIYQGRYELPVLYRQYQAWQLNDIAAVKEWDTYFQAGRDTSEALAETRQMGYSLCRLLNDLGSLPADFMFKINELVNPAFPTVYAGITHLWSISAQDMLQAYAWSWVENQVSAAMKTVPLGQVAGQKILLELGAFLPEIVTDAMQLEYAEISNFTPGLSIAGCRHETQYSRLFRS
ncbi:urease accessory protein UreF [Methylotenera versatilis]|uniref:urease accessory protein UreF n=1 Tax=Methylotenera versatilis TaxID=1055487 RepID=UPI000645D340|nr:urease accessory protein UreF [Methylotenera versatilis]